MLWVSALIHEMNFLELRLMFELNRCCQRANCVLDGQSCVMSTTSFVLFLQGLSCAPSGCVHAARQHIVPQSAQAQEFASRNQDLLRCKSVHLKKRQLTACKYQVLGLRC